jgi:hypothetical protein
MGQHIATRVTEGPRVHIYRPDADDRNSALWRINGFPARVVVWTAEEWERLDERPADAQYLPCGVWCALRLD